MSRHDRRRFFKNLLGGMSLSPFLHSFIPRALAASGEDPLRFISLYNPHGTIHDLWRPRTVNGDEYHRTQFTLDFPNSLMSPLKDYTDKMVILDGFDYRVLYETSSTGHYGGPATSLTGAPGYSHSKAPVETMVPNGSIDQYIASTFGNGYHTPSLQVGISGSYVPMSHSYGPGGVRLPMLTDPLLTYNKLFSDSGESEQEMRLRLIKKQSILDQGVKDLNRLLRKIDGESNRKLQAHLDSIRSIENSMSQQVVCTPVNMPSSYRREDQYANGETIIRLHMDMLVQAMACKRTLVGNILLDLGRMEFIPELNVDIHNDIAHQIGSFDESNGITAPQSKAITLFKWNGTQVKYLMDKLAQVPEGNGTLLDNTLIYWYNELSSGSGHGNIDMPLVLLGGGGGRFQMGQWIRGSLGSDFCTSFFSEVRCPDGPYFKFQAPHNQILVSILNGFGINDNSIGVDHHTGGVDGLLV